LAYDIGVRLVLDGLGSPAGVLVFDDLEFAEGKRTTPLIRLMSSSSSLAVRGPSQILHPLGCLT
jgi:hypothetical protein